MSKACGVVDVYKGRVRLMWMHMDRG